MSSSSLHTGGGSNVSNTSEVRDLAPPRISDDRSRGIDLRNVGFVGFVSSEALAEIQRAETRASLVVTTAATFAIR
jgi:hypothetical protein